MNAEKLNSHMCKSILLAEDERGKGATSALRQRSEIPPGSSENYSAWDG
jgi:hypothetical protein